MPAGSMQHGCAYVKGDVPVSVGYDAQIAILPLLPPPKDDDDDDGGGDPPARDDATLYFGGNDRSVHVYALSPRAAASSADDHPPPTLLDETHVIGGGQHLHPVQSMVLSPDGTRNLTMMPFKTKA